MKRLWAVALVLLLAAYTALAEDGFVPPPQASSPKVEGLELSPADPKVASDEGFLTITATTKGKVQFLVLGTSKVKAAVSGNTVVVSIPPAGGQIAVFAVAVIDGQMTEFARTMITVGTPDPAPEPKPDPKPDPTPVPKVNGRLHVTLVSDPQKPTADVQRLVGSKTLRDALAKSGHIWRDLDVSDPQLKTKRLDGFVRDQGAPCLLLQTDDGKLWPEGKAIPVPTSEQALLDLVKQLTGK
jgi:hypothetical protein